MGLMNGFYTEAWRLQKALAREQGIQAQRARDTDNRQIRIKKAMLENEKNRKLILEQVPSNAI